MRNLVNFIRNNEDALFGEKCSMVQIENAEKELSLKFSAEYTNYLETFGIAAIDGHELTGLDDGNDVVTVTKEIKDRLMNIPNNLYVIEDLYIDGIVAWQDENGTVFQSDCEGHIKKIAHSIIEYIEKY